LTELLGVKINSPDELKLGVMDFQNRVPKTVIKKLRLPLDPKVSEKISEYLVSISGAIKAVQYAITVFRGKSGKIRTRHIDIIRALISPLNDVVFILNLDKICYTRLLLRINILFPYQ